MFNIIRHLVFRIFFEIIEALHHLSIARRKRKEAQAGSESSVLDRKE